jgi:hypothetical protein
MTSIYILEANQDAHIDFSAGFNPTSNVDTLQKAKEYYMENRTTVNVQLTYKDIFNKDYKKNQSIEIKDL